MPEGLQIDVFYFDPLAEAGLYTEWENAAASIQTNESFNALIPAGSIRGRLDRDGNRYRLSFPGLQWWTPKARNYIPKRILKSDLEEEFRTDQIENIRAGLRDEIRAENSDVEPPFDDQAIEDLVAQRVDQRVTQLVNDGLANHVSDARRSAYHPVANLRGEPNQFITNPPEIRCTGPFGDIRPVVPTGAPEFLLSSSGYYEIRIQLSPRTVVLHWNVGPGSNPGDSTQRSYNYHVDNGGRWRAGGVPGDQSWRLWLNGLRMTNAPQLQRRNGVTIDLARTDRQSYWNTRRSGFVFHAAAFEVNSVGVCMLGMRGAPNQTGNWRPHTMNTTPWPPRFPQAGEEANVSVDQQTWNSGGEASPLLTPQILKGLRQVARMCSAWGLDPMHPNRFCTHSEVDRSHWYRPGGKWDITWLPYGLQAAYGHFIANYDEGLPRSELCERGEEGEGNRLYRPSPPDNVSLPDGWRSDHWRDGLHDQHTNTDRVSDFLRRLVKGMMDEPRIINPQVEDGHDIFDLHPDQIEGNRTEDYAHEGTLPFRYVRLPGQPEDDRILLEPYAGDLTPR